MSKNILSLKHLVGFLILPLPIILITACQSSWYPQVGFGSSVNDAVAAQTVNKDGPKEVKRETQGMDGPAAKASIDNYQRSFEQTGTSSMYGSSSNTIISPAGSAASSNMPSITGR